MYLGRFAAVKEDTKRFVWLGFGTSVAFPWKTLTLLQLLLISGPSSRISGQSGRIGRMQDDYWGPEAAQVESISHNIDMCQDCGQAVSVLYMCMRP